MKKRITTLLLALVLLCGINVSAAETLYDSITENIITKGVTEKHIRRLTTDGWQNIFVTEIDLNTEYVDVISLISNEGLNTRTNVLDLAVQNNALAAVNSDFFQICGSYPSKATPLGTIVIDGRLASTPARGTAMATAAVSKDKVASFGYWDQYLTITAPNGDGDQIYHVNKYFDTGGLVLYTPDFGNNAPGYALTDCEMMVRNGVVTAITEKAQGSWIPDDGYIIASTTDQNRFLQDHFQVGDPVKIDTWLSNPAENYKMAMGGGTLLVKDGAEAKFTHTTGLGGYNPRTAMGTSADGKKVYLVTVDGRQKGGKGLTLSGMASLMIELGCYNAINFDGGGSTTYVSKAYDEAAVTLKNSVSDGSMRKVTDGVGVVSTAPEKMPVSRLEISFDDAGAFVGIPMEIRYQGLDDYYRVQELDPAQFSITCDESAGNRMEGNMLIAAAPGTAEITVSYGDLSQTVSVPVSNVPVLLQAEPAIFNVENGAVIQPAIYGVSGDGKKTQIPLSSLYIEDGGGALTAANGTITVNSNAPKAYRISYGDVYTYIGINTDQGLYNMVYSDPMMTAPAEEGTKVTVFGQTAHSTLFQSLSSDKAAALSYGQSALEAYIGAYDESIMSHRPATTNVFNGLGYWAAAMNNTLFIQLNNDQGGIKAGGNTQWSQLGAQLENVLEKNVFLFLDKNPEIAFSDPIEKEVFDKMIQDKLVEKGKDVFIFFDDTQNTITAKNGIRYFGLSGVKNLQAHNIHTINGFHYLQFNITQDGTVTYEKVFPYVGAVVR